MAAESNRTMRRQSSSVARTMRPRRYIYAKWQGVPQTTRSLVLHSRQLAYVVCDVCSSEVVA